METVNRILQEKITARIAPNKAVLIFGARRVGKTVMMRKIVDNYSGRTMMLNGELRHISTIGESLNSQLSAFIGWY